jgi:RNAse (barnase) inhibitor barstar
MNDQMISQLTRLQGPVFFGFTGTASDLTDFSWAVANACLGRLAVRTVRGKKMSSPEALFDEFAAALQFPDYFGENWSALDECLADLSWLPSEGYLLVIRDAASTLASSEADFGIWINILSRVAEEWSQPVEEGQVWDRPGKPFHFLLHASLGDTALLRRRVHDAGVKDFPDIKHV